MPSLSQLGWVHMVFGLLSLMTGTIVILSRKGNRRHRSWGYAYLFSMVATNITALLIYDLTGTFNFFHASAFLSLATLIMGMASVLRRAPRQGRIWVVRQPGAEAPG